MSNLEDFPEELTDTVKNFHGSLGDLKGKLDLMLSQPRTELYDKLDPMGKAKMDLGLAKNLVLAGNEFGGYMTVMGKTISTDDFYEVSVHCRSK